MSARDDSTRESVRPYAEQWVAESPFVGEAEKEQTRIDPWYKYHTPFVEGLGEKYAPEVGWGSDLAALEAESPFQSAFEQGRTTLGNSPELEEEFVIEEDLRFQRPECQNLVKKITRVAVVGGGLAGLMAARRLSQFGVKVTLFEAYKEVGGRVRSNRTFSQGRITEEGAELIGSFHTKWLGLAREYGLAVVSRMDPDLYQRAGLDVKLKLEDKILSMDKFIELEKAMKERVLKPIALLAKLIRDPSRPWQQDALKKFDGMSVQDALPKFCKIAKRTKGNKDELLWKMIEFKLVNDEVAPLDEMNFLGLLCKVRGGQGERFGAGLPPIPMGYWDELEIFRCADGCQQLATEMEAEVRRKPGCRIDLDTMVKVIDIKKDKVELTWVPVTNGKPALGSGQTETFEFVILAIPPSVWDEVTITVNGEDPKDPKKPDLMSMAPAVKFFSDMKDRFWIKEKAAPYGGSLTLGQVWEGTDNQTRIEVEIPGPQGRPQKVKQGIVLSVFTGPILPGRRVPTEKEFPDGLKELYKKYDPTPVTGNVRNTLFANWPIEPFIETGYVSPTKDQIFTIGKELSKPFHDRLFFAGEHTQMAFFGYMEGALRSGERAAHTLMLKKCGLLKEPALKSPSRPLQRAAPASSKPPVITASAAPIRAKTASEYETEVPLAEHSPTGYPWEAESPFLYQEPFVGESEEEWEPRAAALASESPFVGAFEERRSRFDEDQERYEPPAAEWSSGLTAEEAEDFTSVDYEDELELLHEQPLEEQFDSSAVPKDVADALGKRDWPLALKLAIQAGWRDENELTNLVFFARHQELPPEPLDPKGPKFKQLSAEWTKILNEEVWKAIEASAENTDLVVSGKEVADHHRRFFRGRTGKRLKYLVEDAAREVDLNPGLLGTIMMAETRRPQSYLSSEKVSSYHIGADDFYEGRAAIQARVPAYARIKWDKNQKPSEHLNDAKTNPRLVKTILFDSGPDAVLATAVYVKFREVRLREIATESNGDFDKLPLATRLALTRMAMAAGTAGATPFLKDALDGKDIFIRQAIPVRAYQTQRNATVRTAQAMHLSDWVFGIPVPTATAQPELETFEDDAEVPYGYIVPELAGEVGHPDHETEDDEWLTDVGGELEAGVSRDAPYPLGVELEEHEFRLDRLPEKAQEHFRKGGASWRDAVAEAIRAGISNPNDLADLIFFMHDPARMTAGVGKPIDIRASDFVKLRAEWILYHTIATGLLKPAAAKPAGAVFLPAIPSNNYEDYVAAPTTGHITLMINGRDSGGLLRSNIDHTEAFDSMQKAIESLGPNDSILMATWQFKPMIVPLTVPGPAGMKTWGDLLMSKAKEGVKIRVIVTDFPPLGAGFKSDINALKKMVDQLPASARDNFKYIVSMHPAMLSFNGPISLPMVVATHHQKLMIVRKGGSTIAYCGGLDISAPRTPRSLPGPPYWWDTNFVWHDIHAKLEGLVVRDLEREFVLRWNREKDKSTEPRLPGWKAFENLTQPPVNDVDRMASSNTQKLQMLRTVSVGAKAQDTKNVKRDDIWQCYFRLIGSATRFIFLENQYFYEPKMADAIVKQAQAQSDLIVIIVVSFETDDPSNEYTEHCHTLGNEFFTRLFAGFASTDRLRVYTMFRRLVHSKLILVDDQTLLMGSANANPRGFFLDTELNVMLDDAEAVKSFRHRLWSHDLGVSLNSVAAWSVPDFLAKWDAVAKANEGLKTTPDQMAGEGIIPFDPRTVKGKKSPRLQGKDVLC